jgi:hypothetical protein
MTKRLFGSERGSRCQRQLAPESVGIGKCPTQPAIRGTLGRADIAQAVRTRMGFRALEPRASSQAGLAQ